MLDILNAPAAPAVIRRAEYCPPDWLVPEMSLTFVLGAEATRVTAVLLVTRNGDHDHPVSLDGDGLVPLTVRIDGEETANWTLEGGKLIIAMTGDFARIETEVEINPAENTQLMGLYASGGLLCTQCEAEGFRRITFFPDRPDVLSRYVVRMEADKARYPVLLANGNCTGHGDLLDGRHWAEWRDPFPKPSYLFALVAGNLVANRDQFTTMTGKLVDLAIWVTADDVAKTDHAMHALKLSMAWDEKVYGREYDLGQFNIVAVADFNFGAMENKSLNIFNSRYILADPETATDVDYDHIAGVVAHEYFHNWSGNRVTCRDWFQLSLKEGFTVFRDQCFSADLGSAAVKRIDDVRALRSSQFTEDSGPLAHPVRPDSYMEIANFYTSTIYNKGAEVIRMMHILAGPDAFRKGTDLYFDRHDGQAVTCEDFVLAMEAGAGLDLAQFRRWYEQAGTPAVDVRIDHDPISKSAMLHLSQTLAPTPGQPVKSPMVIPLKIALFDRITGTHQGEHLIVLDQENAAHSFQGFAQPPILSINRGFTAPVIISSDQKGADLAFLSAHDDDAFARYEAMQQLMVDTLVGAIASGTHDHHTIVSAVKATLENNALDPAFVAESVLLPSEAYLGDQMLVVDPDTIHKAREALRKTLGQTLADHWRAAYGRNQAKDFVYSPEAKGARLMKNVALAYLSAADDAAGASLALRQFETADNMTDRQAALSTLANSASTDRIVALDIFYNRYRDNALVLDKWFTTQALSTRSDTLDAVSDLLGHRDFTLANPNRVRALVGAFGVNQLHFHAKSGRGYRLYADVLIDLDKINPQTAAKLLPPLGRWRRFDEGRQIYMKAELERILAVAGLSKDLFEQVSKSLA